MDRKPLARVQSREERVTFRATADEAKELRQDAATQDVPLSWLIRRRLRMGRSMEHAMSGTKAAGG